MRPTWILSPSLTVYVRQSAPRICSTSRRTTAAIADVIVVAVVVVVVVVDVVAADGRVLDMLVAGQAGTRRRAQKEER